MIKTNRQFKMKSLVLGVASALAIAASSAALADRNQALDLNIEGQSAGTALLELAKNAGVQIMVPNAIGGNVQLGGIQGEYTLTSALDAMLAETGLTYEFRADDSVVISTLVAGEEGDDSDDEDLEEIVVTGSAIRNTQPTSQLKTYTAEDIAKLGVSSTEDFIRKLPQNFSGLNSFSSTNSDVQKRNGGNIDAVGSSAANLSGLGSDATLILINGRRTAQSALFEGGVVNLATIPLTSIERVEILLDGASARYGADAVGGVINFITKKDYVGAETSVRYEDGRNGGNGYRISQLIGYNWDTGGVTATLSYQERKPVSTVAVGADQPDQTARGGSDFSETAGIRFNATGEVFEAGTLLETCSFLGDLTDPTNIAICQSFYPGRDLNEFSRGDSLGFLSAGNDGTNFDPSIAGTVDADNQEAVIFFPQDQGVFSETTSFNLSANQDITDGINAYTELTYTETTSTNRGAPLSFASVLVPQSNAFNSFGEDVFVQYTPSAETFAGQLPFATFETESTRIDVNVGFTADLPFGDWQARVNFGYSEDEVDTGGLADGSRELDPTSRLTLAAESAALRTRFDELLESANRDEALNLFGNGTAQSPLISQVAGPVSVGSPGSTSESFEAQADGSIFSISGGDARLAVGVEYRKNERDFSNDILRTANSGEGTGFQFTEQPSETVTAVFTELDLPLISEDNALPGVQSLRLNVGARWEEYQIDDAFAVGDVEPSGTVNYVRTGEATFTNTSPRIGLNWQLVDDFSIQASWGESFRAPNFSELLGSSDGSIGSPVDNAFNCVDDVNDPRPLGERDFGGDLSCGFGFLNVANPDLEPETSTTTSVGFDWTPSFVEGLTIEADYRRTDFTDRIAANTDALVITSGGNQDIVDQLPESLIRFADGTPKAGQIQYIEFTSVNFAERLVEVVDFNVDYQFDTDLGDFRATLNGVYTGTFDDTSTTDSEAVNRVDTDLGPEAWRGRFALSWARDVASVNLFVNYSGSYTHTYSLPGSVTEASQKIGSYWTIDMTTAYDFDDGWRVELGADNLTNNVSPFYDSAFGFDTRVYNPTGRRVYAEVKKTFEF